MVPTFVMYSTSFGKIIGDFRSEIRFTPIMRPPGSRRRALRTSAWMISTATRCLPIETRTKTMPSVPRPIRLIHSSTGGGGGGFPLDAAVRPRTTHHWVLVDYVLHFRHHLERGPVSERICGTPTPSRMVYFFLLDGRCV